MAFSMRSASLQATLDSRQQHATPTALRLASCTHSPCSPASSSGRTSAATPHSSGHWQCRDQCTQPAYRSRTVCQAVSQLLPGELDEEERDPTLQARRVQWYPGHIARAERQLRERLKLVDLVLEVRDARIPQSTRHPQVADWCGTKPRLVLLNRLDMVSQADQEAWSQHFSQLKEPVYWTNGNSGAGVQKAVKAALQLSKQINSKRAGRGLQPRAVRAVAVGFPNVGKSALINRMLGRRVCDSAPKPGVTRQLQWARVGGDLDLLDAPGVLPMSMTNQVAAQRLAICNDIGEASYEDSSIAAAMVETFYRLPTADALRAALQRRYGIVAEPHMTGEDYVWALAEAQFQGEVEKAGGRLLRDYRAGALGPAALELPQQRPAAHGQQLGRL